MRTTARVGVALVLLVPLVLSVTGCKTERGDTTSRAGRDTAAAAAAPTAATTASADTALRSAMADSTVWPSFGRDYTNQRYSPLTQISAANVRGLVPAWSYKTGLPHAFEASPVVVGGTMYVSTPLNHVVALDPATGTKKWEYSPKLGVTVHCCGPVNRGVAVYGNRVYMGRLDGRLVALDAANGREVWNVQVADNQRGYALTGAPVVVDGKVIVGTSGAEYGVRGYLVAYDAGSGKEVWRFYLIPSPEEGGWWGQWAQTDPFGTPLHRNIQQEKADSAKYADAWKVGGGSTWNAPAIDLDLGLAIFVVGNPSPDLDGSVRPGDNLYTESIVAIDLKTGKHKWHFQQVPHDVWDLDATSPVVLFDARDSSGTTVHAVAQAGKTGWVYVLDRATGKPIRRSNAFVPQANMFAQPTEKGVRMLPGANGGSEWSPPAYSPQTNYLYVLGLHQPMLYKARHEEMKPPAFWLGGAFVGTGEPEYGLFSAVDLNTGKVAWQKKVGRPMVGGALATAGGLVFVGTADRELLAFDAKSGQQIWRYQAKAGVNAPPISYAINGTQYIAVAAGGNYQINSPRGDEVLAFKLGTAGGAGAAPDTSARKGKGGQ
jgi:alcohol dehydrogenase (cytochrome c)